MKILKFFPPPNVYHENAINQMANGLTIYLFNRHTRFYGRQKQKHRKIYSLSEQERRHKSNLFESNSIQSNVMPLALNFK